MTTGCACPSCGAGVTPYPGQPCRRCEIEALPAGPGRALAEFLRRLGGPEPARERYARSGRRDPDGAPDTRGAGPGPAAGPGLAAAEAAPGAGKHEGHWQLHHIALTSGPGDFTPYEATEDIEEELSPLGELLEHLAGPLDPDHARVITERGLEAGG